MNKKFLHKPFLYPSIFLLCFLVRAIYIWFSGFDPYVLQADSVWLNQLSDQILEGNFDFDIGRFIAAPLYQCIIAAYKYVLGSYWMYLFAFSQVALSSLSGVYLYKLARLLFRQNPSVQAISVLSASLYAFFPPTFWWVGTFATETFFQSFLIICVFYLVKSLQQNSYVSLLTSAFFFGITFLHKSHILVFAPFIVGYIFLFSKKNFQQKIGYALTYALISCLFTLPSGLYNLQKHGTYVLSSNGAKYQFYLGNSEVGYRTVVDVPPKNSDAYWKLKNVNEDAAYFNGEAYDRILQLPQLIKQDLFFKEAMQWIRQNPSKFVELKVYNLFFFLIPGVSWRHYELHKWLASFVVSLPLYFLAYFGMLKALNTDFQKHAWILGLVITMVIFSVVFYVQNRFRTISLEPFYLLYAAFAFVEMARDKLSIDKVKK